MIISTMDNSINVNALLLFIKIELSHIYKNARLYYLLLNMLDKHHISFYKKLTLNGSVAQWLERTPDKREVGSSTLPRPTSYFLITK